MLLTIQDNENDSSRTAEVPGDEVLIGSGRECDVVLEGEGVFRQHARVVRCSMHYFLVVQREENGDIEPVIREELSEFGHHFHWGRERRIDRNWFEVGKYSVRVGIPG